MIFSQFANPRDESVKHHYVFLKYSTINSHGQSKIDNGYRTFQERTHSKYKSFYLELL